MKKYKKFIMFLLILFCMIPVPLKVNAQGISDLDFTYTENGKNASTKIDTGKIKGTYNNQTFWNNIYNKYGVIINGIIGIATITALIFLIINIVKYASSGGNPGEKRQASMTILWSLIATILLGGVLIIFNFGLNILK